MLRITMKGGASYIAKMCEYTPKGIKAFYTLEGCNFGEKKGFFPYKDDETKNWYIVKTELIE